MRQRASGGAQARQLAGRNERGGTAGA